MPGAAKRAPEPRRECGRTPVAYAMHTARLKDSPIGDEILPADGARHLSISHFLDFAFAFAASIVRACRAFDALRPHARCTARAKTERIVQRHLAAAAGVRGHVDALLADKPCALVARIHALIAVHGAASIACCAALVAHAARALLALDPTTQRAIARRSGGVHFKRCKGRERFFFICAVIAQFFSMTESIAATSEDPEPITLFEFLDFEFHFEMAAHIQCAMTDLVDLRRTDPVRYKEAALHVIRMVSQPCQFYIMQKGMQQKLAREKRLGTSTASQ